MFTQYCSGSRDSYPQYLGITYIYRIYRMTMIKKHHHINRDWVTLVNSLHLSWNIHPIYFKINLNNLHNWQLFLVVYSSVQLFFLIKLNFNTSLFTQSLYNFIECPIVLVMCLLKKQFLVNPSFPFIILKTSIKSALILLFSSVLLALYLWLLILIMMATALTPPTAPVV